jgi:hypothetical protein
MLPENQERYVAIFNRKLPKINPYYQNMQKLFSDKVKYPSKTVMDWLNCFAYVRTTRREIQAQASRYFTPVQHPADNAIDIHRKDVNKKPKGSDTVYKPQVSRSKFQQKKDKYHSNSNCWKCGSWKHDKNACDSKNPDCNQEKGQISL